MHKSGIHHLIHHIRAIMMMINPITYLMIHLNIYNIHKPIHCNTQTVNTIMHVHVYPAYNPTHINSHLTNYINKHITAISLTTSPDISTTKQQLHQQTHHLKDHQMGLQTNNTDRNNRPTAGPGNGQQESNNMNATIVGLNNSIVDLMGQQQETKDNMTSEWLKIYKHWKIQ